MNVGTVSTTLTMSDEGWTSSDILRPGQAKKFNVYSPGAVRYALVNSNGKSQALTISNSDFDSHLVNTGFLFPIDASGKIYPVELH